ncbi:hypothetical protein Tco_1351015, partial [Tanacetum coccineum]
GDMDGLLCVVRVRVVLLCVVRGLNPLDRIASILRHGELITIFGAVVKPTLGELLAYGYPVQGSSRICDALARFSELLVQTSATMRFCFPAEFGSEYAHQRVYGSADLLSWSTQLVHFKSIPTDIIISLFWDCKLPLITPHRAKLQDNEQDHP